MKTVITLITIILLQNFFSFRSYSQGNYNATIEYCTGTWVQWAPCGNAVIDQILQEYPNTVALAYHGAGNDPWQSYSTGIRGLFGFAAYPTGVVNRKTGIIPRNNWYNEVELSTLFLQPTVSINILDTNYNALTRTLSATVNINALSDLSGNFYISYILTENNLIYSQTGNSSCPGDSNYIHNHVVKSMLNGDLGELIHSGNWNSGTNVMREINYIIPDAPQVSNVSNCELNILVYKEGTSISTNYNIQQALKTSLFGITHIPGFRLKLSVLTEGLYSQTFNQTSRRDSIKVYLCESIAPFNKIDSAMSKMDSLTFDGIFEFFNAPAGNYYIVVNHLNSIQTWSKLGGNFLQDDGSLHEYDYTSSINQAYGNNLKLKGSKYCIYSGDINQDGFMTLFDVIPIYNDAASFISGNYLLTDLTGDRIVDLSDVSLCYNNSSSFVSLRRP